MHLIVGTGVFYTGSRAITDSEVILETGSEHADAKEIATDLNNERAGERCNISLGIEVQLLL